MSRKPVLEKEDLVRLIEEGKTSPEIARLRSCSPATVTVSCHRYGIRLPRLPDIKHVLERETLLSLIAEGLSTSEIAQHMNCYESTVHRSLKRYGIPLPEHKYKRPAGYRTFNYRFFESIDSEEKAYILGFIAADGGRDKNNGIRISIHPRDVDILQKIIKAIGYDGSERLTEHGKRVTLGLYSVELARDLEELGITRNKTKRLEFAKGVPDHLMIHYMRGIMDGDGHFSKTSRTAGFVTGSSKFAEGFREWYRNKYGQYPYEKCEDGTKWRFVFHLRDIPYIRDLYKSATIYLNRKIELYKKNWSVMI